MEGHNYFIVGERTHRVHGSAQLGHEFDKSAMDAARATAVKNSRHWCEENESYNNQDFYIVRMPLSRLIDIGIVYESEVRIEELAS